MKTKLTIIAILLTIACVHAQTENFKHFEIDASINFWSPSSTHMKATNSATQVLIGDDYTSYGGISGYGTSIAPALNLTYYFKSNLGISLGFYPLIMDNELYIKNTDTTYSNYENEASIVNFTLGISGRMQSSSAYNLFYGCGLNFVPNYDLMMTSSSESTNPSDLEANDLALGFYFETGIKIKLYKFIALKTGTEYSFIPSELKYTNSESVKINEKTNLGGLGLHTGLSFNF
ncbi:MAG: OmpW family outer membrane protein [Candidatus Tenebribacter davisii]|nr:OmpW family outer membrane protein [Candidatus Tenebribacter davisii]